MLAKIPSTQTLSGRFKEIYGGEPKFIARAPGRVNLLGEHIDYNEGWVLPVAINHAVYLIFTKRDDNFVSISTADLNDKVTFSLNNLKQKKDVSGKNLPVWAQYSAGVAWALKNLHLETVGLNALIVSDLPMGSGLSSSAALEVAFALAWRQLSGWKLDPVKMALLCQKAENKYVGAMCGIMDQYTSILGEENCALFLDCRLLESRNINIPEKVSLVVADTGVRRELGSSEHNTRRQECMEGLKILKKVLPGVKALRDVSAADFNKHRHLLPTIIQKRVKHVVEECARIQMAVKFLEEGNIEFFGKLMNECHTSLRDFYEVSCPELDIMVEIGQKIKGCYGARLTGAGFGGCTINLVKTEKVKSFKKVLAENYQRVTGQSPKIYHCHASNGAQVSRLGV